MREEQIRDARVPMPRSCGGVASSMSEARQLSSRLMLFFLDERCRVLSTKRRASAGGSSCAFGACAKFERALQDHESIWILCLVSDSVPWPDQVHYGPVVQPMAVRWQPSIRISGGDLRIRGPAAWPRGGAAIENPSVPDAGCKKGPVDGGRTS